ncbi:MAG: exosortase A [Steroidobacteraceae bacterium]
MKSSIAGDLRQRLSELGPAAPVLLLVLVAALALAPTWRALARIWHESSDYSHGYAVLVIASAWFLIAAPRASSVPARGSPLALVALIASILVWLVAYRAQSEIGQQLLLPPILGLAVWTAFGWEAARRVASPLLFLYFAIPVWDLLVPALQQITVGITENLLDVLKIPVSMDGVNVTIPEGRFRIAEGCSGKNFLMIALGVATLFAAIERFRGRRIVAYLAVTAALALVANWLRVIIVIYAGHATQMRHYLVAREHITFGWFIFAILLVCVLLIGLRLARKQPPIGIERSPLAARAAARTLLRPALLATAALVSLPPIAIARVVDRDQRSALSVRTLTWPAASDASTSGPLPAGSDWSPRYPGAPIKTRALYLMSGTRVEVFAAQYGTQRAGSELINFENSLLDQGWNKIRVDSLGAGVGTAGSTSKAAIIEAETPTGERWLIAYVYRVGDVVTASAPLAQLAYGVLSWLQPVDSMVVASAVRCAGDCRDATQAQVRFWLQIIAPIVAPQP